MTASEFAFLALGLLLGVAVGGALIEVLRARPPSPREVRLTVSPDSVPRRPSTLASTIAPASVGPARGGPADRRGIDREPLPVMATAAAARRIGAPSPAPGDPFPTAVPALVGISIEPEPDRVLAALRATPAAAGVPAAGRTMTALQDDGSLRGEGTGGAGASPETPGQGGGWGAAPASLDPDTDPCAERRRAAEERCAVAARLAEVAEGAAATLRERQRESDEHETLVAKAAAAADARAIRVAKEAAQHQFRVSSAGAGSREAVDAAAREWLQEINRINRSAREATIALRREQDAVNALVPVLERLSVEADAARINAEAAGEACLAAREAVAECQEAARRAPEPTVTAPLPAPDAPGGPGAEGDGGSGDDVVGGGLSPQPVLYRLLAGDREALRRIVAALAAGDAAMQGHWQLQLSELLDAILARAIEASMLDFPEEHGFWGPFTREQSRDIAAALASLGYRFDGLTRFADGRVPSQRDLSLAVGFAGLDPMRIRRWPNEAEMTELFRDVTVAADEYVAANAGGLTLGEMVTMLGRRADGLTDLWNAWGQVRPLLIAPA